MRSLDQFAWIALAVAVGCSPTDDTKTGTSTNASDVSAALDAIDGGAVDTDAVATDDLGAATKADAAKVQSQCPGESGCPCIANGDCDEGRCIDTPTGRVCAAPCIETCDEGNSCVTLVGGVDKQAFCVPTYGVPCRPCDAQKDCDSPAAFAQHCVDYGPEKGAFCGNQCADDTACPGGFVCRLVKKRGGGEAKACVRAKGDGVGGDDSGFGLCSCSLGAVAAALTTTCWAPVLGDKGAVVASCKGERGCGPGVLSSCIAFSGTDEECVDTQCSGKTEG